MLRRTAQTVDDLAAITGLGTRTRRRRLSGEAARLVIKQSHRTAGEPDEPLRASSG
jgi:hypothetical protein